MSAVTTQSAKSTHLSSRLQTFVDSESTSINFIVIPQCGAHDLCCDVFHQSEGDSWEQRDSNSPMHRRLVLLDGLIDQ